MDRLTVLAGLDYADAFVQVCVMDSTGQTLGNRRCDNDWQAISRYAGQFGGKRPVKAVVVNGAGRVARWGGVRGVPLLCQQCEVEKRSAVPLHASQQRTVRRMIVPHVAADP